MRNFSMSLTISEIFQLYMERGQLPYGNAGVNQLEHALQCATLAEAANQSDEMVVACLFHDLGHLLHNFGVRAADQGIDDRHEYRVIPRLQSMFSPAVLEPIRLHVQAKRYLCAVDISYWDQLSVGSKETLELQGELFSEQEAKTFIAQPYAQEAVQLRRWDDISKVIGLQTPDFQHFARFIYACIS